MHLATQVARAEPKWWPELLTKNPVFLPQTRTPSMHSNAQNNHKILVPIVYIYTYSQER